MRQPLFSSHFAVPDRSGQILFPLITGFCLVLVISPAPPNSNKHVSNVVACMADKLDVQDAMDELNVANYKTNSCAHFNVTGK